MNIAIAPAPSSLGPDDALRFYREVSESEAVGRIYAGEIHCSKRDIFDRRLLTRIKEVLEEKKKKLVVSTPVYRPDDEEFRHILRISRIVDEVEINNLGFLIYFLRYSPRKKISLGPYFPLGAVQDLEFLFTLEGFKPSRIAFRPDFDEKTHELFRERFPEVRFEMTVYGHLPLSFGWGCVTAEALGTSKQGCGFICNETEPLSFRNLSHEQVLVMEGKTVLSGKIFFSLKNKDFYQARGIEDLRIYPLPFAAGKTVKIFDDYASGRLQEKQVKKALFSLSKAKLRTKALVS